MANSSMLARPSTMAPARPSRSTTAASYGRDEALQDARAAGGGLSPLDQVVLQQQGNAVETRAELPRAPTFVCGPGLPQGRAGPNAHHGAQRRPGLGPRECGLHQLDGRDAAPVELSAGLGQAGQGRCGVGRHDPSSSITRGTTNAVPADSGALDIDQVRVQGLHGHVLPQRRRQGDGVGGRLDPLRVEGLEVRHVVEDPLEIPLHAPGRRLR